MKIRFWGCRGSLAAPNSSSLRYGGNTCCVQVTLSDGTLLVLDAGTGIRLAGTQVGVERPIHLLLTHLHMDHVEGLGFFAPMWQPNIEMHIWGPPSSQRSLENNLARFFSPPLFPVDIHDVPSRPRFHDVLDGSWQIGSATITAEYVTHAGPTVGYRIEEGSSSLVYIPDHEPESGEVSQASGMRLASGASTLIHDSRFTSLEYQQHHGEGHSSVESAVRFATAAGVSDLILFHHDPTHSDDQLDDMLATAKVLWGDRVGGPQLAKEGMELTVGKTYENQDEGPVQP